jgi:hypothetical protein
MKDKRHIKSFNEATENLNSELSKETYSSISDVMCSFIRENLSVGLSMDGTSVTVKLFLKEEIISEYTEGMTIYKRDIEGLD